MKATASEIARFTAEYWTRNNEYVEAHELIGRDRSRRTTEPRYLAMYAIRNILHMPYDLIGVKFDGRDPQTVQRACRIIKRKPGPRVDLPHYMTELSRWLGPQH